MSEALKIERIVIGTSLTEASDDVVRTGVAIAAATSALPWLLHAYSLKPFPPEHGTVDARWVEAEEEALRDRLVQQAQRTGLAALPGFRPGQIRLATDGTARAVLDLAREIRADLLVVGASEGGALGRLFLGSTADSVIRHTTCPVLVVRSAAAFPPERVEIPVDLSLLSAHALRQGKDFLAQIGAKAETEVLFVLSPFEVASTLHFNSEQVERFALSELHRFLAVNGASHDLIRMPTGNPPDEIVSALEKRAADLVILGTQGRRGFDRLLLGSVAIEMLHRAPCNLLVVPSGTTLPEESVEEPILGADWRYVSDEAPDADSRS